MVEILVNGIEFYGYHGVPEAERAVGHRFLADLSLTTEAPATQTDRLEDTVDYGAVILTVQRVGAAGSVQTVERLARLIGEAVLNENSTVTEVTVELHKLLPPAPAIVASAGVRLTLQRQA